MALGTVLLPWLGAPDIVLLSDGNIERTECWSVLFGLRKQVCRQECSGASARVVPAVPGPFFLSRTPP